MINERKHRSKRSALAVVVAAVCATTLLPPTAALAQETSRESAPTERALIAGVTTCTRGLCVFTATKSATQALNAWLPVAQPAVDALKGICPLLGFSVVGGAICGAIVFFVGRVYSNARNVIKAAVTNGQCFFIKYVKWGWIPYAMGRTSANCA